MMQRFLEGVFAIFTPPALATDATSWEFQRVRLLILAALMVTALSLPSIAVHYFSGAYVMGHLAVLAALAGVLVLAVLRWRQSMRSAALLLLLYMFVIITVSIFFGGGIVSPITSTLYTPPLFALLFIGRRAMILTVGVAIGIIGVLTLCYELGMRFPVLFNPSLTGILNGFVHTVTLLGVLAAFYYSDAIRLEAFTFLQEERDSVQDHRNASSATGTHSPYQYAPCRAKCTSSAGNSRRRTSKTLAIRLPSQCQP
jgi:hypothetical protein